jgi:endonuclease YncB( thermonuclease family)
MLPWYAAAAVAIGGIAFYPHRTEIVPQLKSVAEKTVAAVEAPHPLPKPVVVPTSLPRRPVPISPIVPPAPIPSATPAARPTAVPVSAPASGPQFASPIRSASPRFGICGQGPAANCVLDGNTFWTEGVRIRLADVEPPEGATPRCAEEQRLASAAKLRLQSLLNAGSFAISPGGYRDQDQDGSKLRLIMREGRSVGDQLVKEGLAHRGTTHASWCT